jgi:hypothetical protein
VLLVALEEAVGVEEGVVVVEAHDEPDHDLLVGEAVDEAAAERPTAERVPHRVHHGAGRQASLRDLPQLLDPDRVDHRELALGEAEPREERLGQAAPRALGQDRDLGPEVDARLEVRLLVAVLVDPLVARAHADDAIALVEELRAREAGEQVDALRLSLARHPLDELVEADHVVAVVPEGRWDDRQRDLPPGREHVDVVLADRNGDRGALGLEVRDELAQRARVEDGAR